MTGRGDVLGYTRMPIHSVFRQVYFAIASVMPRGFEFPTCASPLPFVAACPHFESTSLPLFSGCSDCFSPPLAYVNVGWVLAAGCAFGAECLSFYYDALGQQAAEPELCYLLSLLSDGTELST